MEEILKLQEKLIKYSFQQLNKKYKNILEKFNVSLEIPDKVPRIRFSKAVEIVKKMGIETEEGDLTPAGERALGEWAKKEKNSDFIFLTHFPWEHKVFYAKRRRGGESESFDLLYKGLEITTGGLREEDYKKRAANAKKKKIDPDSFDHLRFFKYGNPPHGGVAFGIERLTMQMLNLENIREASLTPRDPERLSP